MTKHVCLLIVAGIVLLSVFILIVLYFKVDIEYIQTRSIINNYYASSPLETGNNSELVIKWVLDQSNIDIVKTIALNVDEDAESRINAIQIYVLTSSQIAEDLQQPIELLNSLIDESIITGEWYYAHCMIVNMTEHNNINTQYFYDIALSRSAIDDSIRISAVQAMFKVNPADASHALLKNDWDEIPEAIKYIVLSNIVMVWNYHLPEDREEWQTLWDTLSRGSKTLSPNIDEP